MNNTITMSLEILLLTDLFNAKVIDQELYKEAKQKIFSLETAKAEKASAAPESA